MSPQALNAFPIFPLDQVLFPGGQLTLKIFEQRYIDMVSQCLKHDQPFGVCLINKGYDTGHAAEFYPFGTLARIRDWNQSEDGLLLIETVGEQRFKTVSHSVQKDQLCIGRVRLIDEPDLKRVPKPLHRLTEMLRAFLEEYEHQYRTTEDLLNDASWVGYRLSELLPINNLLRQRLLEYNDPVERLHVLVGLFSGGADPQDSPGS